MKLKHVFLGFLMGFFLVANAQSSSKEVLFTIDDQPFYTDEFIRVYNKNLDLVKDESQKDLNQYLELFIGYKFDLEFKMVKILEPWQQRFLKTHLLKTIKVT